MSLRRLVRCCVLAAALAPAAAPAAGQRPNQHLQEVRTTLVADGAALYAAAGAISVAPARLLGPLRLGVVDAVRVDDLTVEWRTGSTWTTQAPPSRPAPLTALALALSGLPAAHARASGGEAGRVVVLQARRCDLETGQIRCRKGSLRIGERTSFFRSLAWDGTDWRLEPAPGRFAEAAGY